MTPVKFPTHSCLFSQILLVHKTKSINLAFCKQKLKYLVTQNTQDTNERPSAITTHCRHTQRSSVVHLRHVDICNGICDQCRRRGKMKTYSCILQGGNYKTVPSHQKYDGLLAITRQWIKTYSLLSHLSLGGYSTAKPFLPPAFFLPCHSTMTLKLHSRYCRLWDNNQFSQSGLKHCQNPETTSKKCSATSACFPWSHHSVRSRSVSSKDWRTSPKYCKNKSSVTRPLVQAISCTTLRSKIQNCSSF